MKDINYNPKIKFHWLVREVNILSLEKLSNLSKELDDSGYYSALIVYNSNTPDGMIKASNIINKNQKLKYMIAIRPHAISPEYLKMKCDAFNEIQKNRLIINFVAGNLTKNEKQPFVLLQNNKKQLDLEERKDNLVLFVENFYKLYENLEMPEIAISGSSQKIIDCASKFKTMLILEEGIFLNKKNNLLDINKKIIAITPRIKLEKENLENFIEEQKIKNGFVNPYWVGNESEIMEKIKLLISQGIHDIMICPSFQDDDNNYRIHNVVQKILKEYENV